MRGKSEDCGLVVIVFYPQSVGRATSRLPVREGAGRVGRTGMKQRDRERFGKRKRTDTMREKGNGEEMGGKYSEKKKPADKERRGGHALRERERERERERVGCLDWCVTGSVCVCVCVCVRERERERERGRERERERERERLID